MLLHFCYILDCIHLTITSTNSGQTKAFVFIFLKMLYFLPLYFSNVLWIYFQIVCHISSLYLIENSDHRRAVKK